MWRTAEFLFICAIILVFITEFFYPILTGKPVFNSFRKSKPSNTTKATSEDLLDEEIEHAKEKVAEVKNVQNQVDKHFKTAEQLKEESDNLLK